LTSAGRRKHDRIEKMELKPINLLVAAVLASAVVWLLHYILDASGLGGMATVVALALVWAFLVYKMLTSRPE
jgi:hypothetical protein